MTHVGDLESPEPQARPSSSHTPAPRHRGGHGLGGLARVSRCPENHRCVLPSILLTGNSHKWSDTGAHSHSSQLLPSRAGGTLQTPGSDPQHPRRFRSCLE